MRKLSEIIRVEFGEAEPIEGLEMTDVVEIPVIINGKEYSTDEIKLDIEPIEVNNRGQNIVLNRVDIHLKPEFRHKGYGYNIYKSFIFEFGNLFSPDVFRENDEEIPHIYTKLSKEPGIHIQRTNNFYFAYSDEWKSEYGDGLETESV